MRGSNSFRAPIGSCRKEDGLPGVPIVEIENPEGETGEPEVGSRGSSGELARVQGQAPAYGVTEPCRTSELCQDRSR